MRVKLESKVTELTHAHEDQKKETELQAYMEELGGESISGKGSMICNFLKEGNTMADNADKRNLEFGFSDAEYCSSKSKVIPGSATRDDTSKPKPVTPDCKEVICLSDDDEEEEEEEEKEFLPVMKESNRSSNSPYVRTDLGINFLKSRKGSVIWCGDGPFGSKVTDGDALKVLNPVGLTSEIIDSWGELLVQNLNKKGKTTSTFIFTSCISEVVGRNGGSPTIQKIVDSQIRRAVESQILFLPVFTSASKYTGNYWSLLKYDVKSSSWTVFSAMQPRSGGMHHFKPVLPLVEYVEERMLPALVDPKRNTLLTRPNKYRNNIPLQNITRPQRLLDSGVVVCQWRRYLRACDFIDKSTAEEYRFRMVEGFCFPDDMKEE